MMAITSVITVDGPSGVGKGTLCKALAEKLGWHLLDSGAIYRVLALAALNRQLSLTDENGVAALALALKVEFKTADDGVQVWLDGQDVSGAIRTEETGNAASQIAVFPIVREALLARQRAFLQAPGLIADGRDMGTIVFPHAPVKIFLDASAEERAKRRANQLRAKSNYVNLEEILLEIKERDARDRNRKVAPLVAASDALVLDSTDLTIAQVIDKAVEYINNKLSLQLN